MSLPRPQVRPDWYGRAGRVAGAGLAGAVIGAAVAGVWHVVVAAGQACPAPSAEIDAWLCVPGTDAGGVLGSGAVICAGVLAAFAALRLRPLWETVTAGCLVTAGVTFFTAVGISGGLAPALWTESIAAGAGLAAVALAFQGGRAKLAGLALVVVVLLASLIVPRMNLRREEADDRVHEFAALGFPLRLPSVPGYHAVDAEASADGELVVDMAPDGGGISQTAFTVSIAPASNVGLASELIVCESGPPQPPCRVLRPGYWLLTSGIAPVVLSEKGGIIAEAGGPGYPPVSNAVLTQAISSLRPATAAEVAAVE
jgi:hypothetical protein